jgi:transcriptional regulator GlxA family with amidase domain
MNTISSPKASNRRVKANVQRSAHPKTNGSDLEKWIKLARKARFQPSAMAALCSVSLRQMERFFARNFHRTPSRWLRECRCRLARELISSGSSSRTVVNQLHYVDHSHLCHEFDKIYRATPQSFAPRFIQRRTAGLVRPKKRLNRSKG